MLSSFVRCFLLFVQNLNNRVQVIRLEWYLWGVIPGRNKYFC